ncbi:MAG: 4Fe-4S binding protein [Candidatus Omnitrophota bacterium]|nr:MAG: 4Fe-4S binding protein [Candidatus Omnitrophota bacterium]
MHAITFILFVGIALLSVGVLIAKRWTIPVRGFTQLGLFVISEITLVCNRGVSCQNCPLSFGICPVGTSQRLAFIKHFPFYFTLLLIIITGAVFGTLMCGWACPLGFIQDLFGVSPFRKLIISNKLKRARYIFLFLAAILAFLELRFRFLSTRGIEVFHEVTVIGGFLFLSTALFIKRPFCRFVCPAGLIYGKMNALSPFKVILNTERCTGCGECSAACIMNIKPMREVNSDLCVKCFNCKKTCKNKEGAQ